MNNLPTLHIFPDAQALFEKVAHDFAQLTIKTISAKDECSVVLSGGNTPKMLFDTLTANPRYHQEIPWSKIKFFFGDERYVPLTDEQSNYHMAQEHLFMKLPVVKENIFAIPTHFAEPAAAAIVYQSILRQEFKLQDQAFPRFDLLYLGLGADGHTASLLPTTDVVKTYSDAKNALEQHYQLVAATWVETLNMFRITLTPPAINHAEQIVFLVNGADKAQAVQAVLEGPPNPLVYPAQLIEESTRTLWYLDQAAASKLNRQGKV